MTLYEICDKIKNAIKLDSERCVDTETGEILPVQELKALEMSRQDKIENIALWIKNLKAEEKALKEERDNFNSRIKSTKNKREWLEGLLIQNVSSRKFETEKVKVTFRKSVKCMITGSVPEDFLIDQEPKINKAEIRKQLKEGADFDFAELVQNRTVNIK